MKTTAVEDGDNYVLNGDKWYISSANVADIAVVMAKTDPTRRAINNFQPLSLNCPIRLHDFAQY